VKLALIVLLLFVSGCSALELGDLKVEGSDVYAACLKGGAIPYGGGQLSRAKAHKDFKGIVVIGPDCTIMVKGDK
jgi:hypothetical protein